MAPKGEDDEQQRNDVMDPVTSSMPVGERVEDDFDPSKIVDSLPVAEAVPETTRSGSEIAFTTDVEYVKEPNRIAHGNLDDHESDKIERKKRPALISFRYMKQSVDEKLGLGFQSIHGELVISRIAPTSPLTTSPLRRGDRLISLDHHQDVKNWTGPQAASYVRNQSGYISMVFETKYGDSNVAEALVYKPTVGLRLGLELHDEDGRLQIRKIDGSGLLGEMSAIQAGDFVESINSIPAEGMDVPTALEILRNVVGLVSLRTKKNGATEVSLRDVMMSSQLSSRRYSETVIAADELDVLEAGMLIPEDTGYFVRPAFISVTFQKPTLETRIGISFINPTGEELTISKVSRQTLLTESPLKAGCIIHSMNGIPCLRYSSAQFADLLRSLNGTIRLVAEDRLGGPSYAEAMVFKPTPRAVLGLSFSRDIGSLSLSSVQRDGLFSNSIVNTGDKVIAINKIPCEHMQPIEAVAIAQKISESVTILVRVSRRNGVVLSHKAGGNADYGTQTPEDSGLDCPDGSAVLWCVVISVLTVIIVSSM